MDYILTSNGELYHAARKSGWEKEDHKYIKREWKKGKWVYTYPSDAKKSQPLKKNVAEAKARRDAADLIATGRTKTQSAFNKAAIERTKSNKVSSKPYVSKEYQEELAYNSQKNGSGNTKSESTGKESTTSKTETKKATVPVNASKEYQEELAYNSQKNQYPTEIKETVIAEKTIPEKVITEKTIPEKVITESTPSKTSKKEDSWLDKLGDWASDKLGDIGDGLKDFGEDAADWVGDRMDDLHDVTIGKVKDALGYDERDLMASCASKRDEAAADINQALERIESRISAANGKFTDKTREGVEAATNVFLMPACGDYAKADADYARAKEMYDATLLGKIDNWINGKDSSASETDDARAVQKRLANDVTFQRAETEFIANQLACMAVNNWLTEYNSKYHRQRSDAVYNYYTELQDAGKELYDKLNRYAHYGMDLRRPDNSNIELDRIDRIILELEDMFDRT